MSAKVDSPVDFAKRHAELCDPLFSAPVIRARDEQIRRALEEEIESIEASAPYRLNALRAFAAKLGKDGPR